MILTLATKPIKCWSWLRNTAKVDILVTEIRSLPLQNLMQQNGCDYYHATAKTSIKAWSNLATRIKSLKLNNFSSYISSLAQQRKIDGSLELRQYQTNLTKNK